MAAALRSTYCRGFIPVVVMTMLIQHAAAGPDRCPPDPASGPCAFSSMTSSMDVVSFWPTVSIVNNVVQTSAAPTIRTTSGCPVQGGRPRCPSSRMTQATACAGRSSHSTFTIINLGPDAEFLAGNGVWVSGWYPAGKVECFWKNPAGGNIYSKEIQPSFHNVGGGTLHKSINGCVGAFAIRIWGGGSCGSSNLKTPLRAQLRPSPEAPTIQVDDCMAHPYRKKCL